MSSNFRKVLLKIDTQLSYSDLEHLKFLCLSITQRGHASNVDTGLKLFEILESESVISSQDCSVLHELLRKIGRNDLNKMLDEGESKAETQVDSNPVCLDSEEYKFHEMLFEISERMYPRNVDELKFLYNCLPKNKNMTLGIDLFKLLMELNLLGPTNMNTLIEYLGEIGRNDLSEMLKSFKAQSSTRKCGEAKTSKALSNLAREDSLTIGVVHDIRTIPDPETFPKSSYLSDDAVNNFTANFSSKTTISSEETCHQEGLSKTWQSSPGENGLLGLQGYLAHEETKSENLTVNLEPSFNAAAAAADNPKRSRQIPDLPRYKMSATPRGNCLVIDNETFTYNPRDEEAKSLRTRMGSRKDRENISKCFSDLKLDVQVEENLKSADMLETFKKYASNAEENNSQDCFVTFILSHGGMDQGEVYVYGSDGRKIYLKDITCLFRPDVCPSLAGKPKLFFLVCCLGGIYSKAVPKSTHMSEAVHGIQTDDDSDDEEEMATSLICNDNDFLIAYSTVKGNVSFRNTQEGTWYVTALTQVFSEYHERESLQHMLVAVNDRVAQHYVQCMNKDGVLGKYAQVPAPEHTLTKQLWF